MAKRKEVINYKPLHIPPRQRRPGETIWCGKCNRQISTTCKLTDKAKKTCKNASQHRFQSKTYDKLKKRTVPIKTWPKDLRSYEEFTRLHALEVARFKKKGITTIFKKKPSLLRDALKKYFDWLNDVDVPSHKAKKLNVKHIQNQLANLVTFREAISTYETLLVADFSEDHVSEFHDYLIVKNYSAKTYNNKMYTLKHAFDYFRAHVGYDIVNPFDSVSNQPTEAKKSYVQLNDFKQLLELTNVANGIKFEKCADRVKRVSLYRKWLTDFWELALYTGARREDIVSLKLCHVHEMHIDIRDFKTSKAKRMEVNRFLPRSKEFDDLLERIVARYSIEANDYLIAPQESNRKKIANHASKAFSHYWQQLNCNYYARMYSLRDTHITLMINRYGNRYEGIFGTHSKIKTSLDNYASYEELIKQFAGKSMMA